MPASTRVAAIVLAAGASSRMGRSKLTLPYRGTTLLRLAVDRAVAVSDLLPIVVTGYDDLLIREHLVEYTNTAQLVHNPDWKAGMGGSIAMGVTAATADPTPMVYLITLADQPGADEALLWQLLNKHAEHPGDLIAVAYPEGPGVPACFPATYRDELVNQDGQGGARKLLRSGRYPVRTVAPPAPLADVDTPEDYHRLTGRILRP